MKLPRWFYVLTPLCLSFAAFGLVLFALNMKAFAKPYTGSDAWLQNPMDHLGPQTTIAISDTTAIEGKDTTSIATFTVTLSSVSAFSITVDYETVDQTALSSTDYITASGTLTFTPGDLSEVISVTIRGDSIYETDETFVISLSHPIRAVLSDGLAVGTIINDDAAPTLTIQDAATAEGNTGYQQMAFLVMLSGLTEVDALAQFTTVSNTANVDDADYIEASGPVSFPVGTLTQTIEIDIAGDFIDEDDELFYVNLSHAADATIADYQAVGTIENDDFASIVVSPSIGLFTTEAGGEAEFTAALGSQPKTNVTISITISDPTEARLLQPSSGNLSFTNTNWNIPQIVRLAGQDDNEDDDHVEYRATLTSSSDDLEYNSLPPVVINLYNKNDDEYVFLPLVTRQKSNLLFNDDFSQDKGWEEIADGTYSAEVKQGRYYLRHDVANYNVRAIAPALPFNSSYVVTVQARREVDAASGTRYGLLFDFLDNTHFYRFVVDPDNRKWQIHKFDNGYVLLDEGVFPGQADGAKLSVERDQASIRVLVNDQLLSEITDTSYLNGRVGVIMVAPVNMGSGQYAEASFDNFEAEKVLEIFKSSFAFPNSAHNWNTIIAGTASSSFLNGEYVLSQSTANYNIRSIAPVLPGSIPASYSVEVQVYLTPGSDPGTSCGLIFDWLDNTRQYRFMIKPQTQEFLIQRFVNGWQTLPGASGSHPVIMTGSQVNTLKIERDRSTGNIQAYINDQHIGTFADTTYLGGQIGVIVLANAALPAGQTAQAAFDNFLLK